MYVCNKKEGKEYMLEIKLNNVFVWVMMMPLSNSNSLVDELAIHKLSETPKNTFHNAFTKLSLFIMMEKKIY